MSVLGIRMRSRGPLRCRPPIRRLVLAGGRWSLPFLDSDVLPALHPEPPAGITDAHAPPLTISTEHVREHRHLGGVRLVIDTLTTAAVGRYLNVAGERARKIAATDPSFLQPVETKPLTPQGRAQLRQTIGDR